MRHETCSFWDGASTPCVRLLPHPSSIEPSAMSGRTFERARRRPARRYGRQTPGRCCPERGSPEGARLNRLPSPCARPPVGARFDLFALEQILASLVPREENPTVLRAHKHRPRDREQHELRAAASKRRSGARDFSRRAGGPMTTTVHPSQNTTSRLETPRSSALSDSSPALCPHAPVSARFINSGNSTDLRRTPNRVLQPNK